MAEADIKWVKPVALVGGFAGLGKWVVYLVSKAIDAIYFNALRHVPGPKLNALSMIPYARHLLAGTTVENTVKLHEKYGEMVRISPNEVSFISAETAFPDIYGFRTGKLKGHLNMAKDPVWYVKPENGAPAILQANDEDHSRGRRVLAHAFSERALMAQEPLLQRYVGQLVDGLKEVTSASNDAVDMVRWYNWTTFDVIADLMFGESFGCLQDLSTHKYVALLFESLTSLRMIYVLTYYPWLKYFGNFVIDNKILQKRKDYLAWISSQVKKRTERDTVRPDFMTHILANNGSKGTALSQKEIDSNAGLMITAGSETTATVLSGATWLLLTNPNVMQKVKDEIRSKFESYDDITLSRVNEIPYTIAFLSEALRLFPPIPVGFARRVAKGDAFVSGYFVPEGTLVSVSHFAAYHSAQNFKDPGAVVPERWLGDEMYAADKKSAFQPFSFGPRSCLGRNLALAEMRLILAKIVWSFDLELQPGSRDWLRRCRVMRLWQKPELAVRVKEVERS
ncbi:hypothetical protein HO133_002600 [Letharia lupina]|uniref:Cytochrome P450 monooxygenase n=1 Tax=Letharia lupina TaxID=560253 RepID=A0A8H6CCA7_9LECA|nr:uncharacterized protein HO133_002600 [Letharia lupina]KAF6220920.1 hypothetical protein HO133_002600 [Letharia lupina]